MLTEAFNILHIQSQSISRFDHGLAFTAPRPLVPRNTFTAPPLPLSGLTFIAPRAGPGSCLALTIPPPPVPPPTGGMGINRGTGGMGTTPGTAITGIAPGLFSTSFGYGGVKETVLGGWTTRTHRHRQMPMRMQMRIWRVMISAMASLGFTISGGWKRRRGGTTFAENKGEACVHRHP
jgi:hypothetical protein